MQVKKQFKWFTIFEYEKEQDEIEEELADKKRIKLFKVKRRK